MKEQSTARVTPAPKKQKVSAKKAVKIAPTTEENTPIHVTEEEETTKCPNGTTRSTTTQFVSNKEEKDEETQQILDESDEDSETDESSECILVESDESGDKSESPPSRKWGMQGRAM